MLLNQKGIWNTTMACHTQCQNELVYLIQANLKINVNLLR